MNRRKFIVLTSTGVVALGASAAYINFSKNPSDFYPEDLPYVFQSSELINLGNLYLKKFPDENNLKKLKSLLDFNFLSTSIEDINEKIIDDYKKDNTIVLDGYILSKTEGRQCALFSLTQSKTN